MTSKLAVSNATLFGVPFEQLTRTSSEVLGSSEAERALVFALLSLVNDIIFCAICATAAARQPSKKAAWPWKALAFYCGGTAIFRLGFIVTNSEVNRFSLALLLFHNAGEWGLILSEWFRPDNVAERLSLIIPTFLWVMSVLIVTVTDLQIGFLLIATQGAVADFMLLFSYLLGRGRYGLAGICLHGVAVLCLFWTLYGGPRAAASALILLSYPVYPCYALHARERSRELAAHNMRGTTLEVEATDQGAENGGSDSAPWAGHRPNTIQIMPNKRESGTHTDSLELNTRLRFDTDSGRRLFCMCLLAAICGAATVNTCFFFL